MTTILTRGRMRRSRGQTLVEFALVLPIVILLFMILFDFGRVIFAQNAIAHDAREATRVGSVGTSDLFVAQDFADRYVEIRRAARAIMPLADLPDSAITGGPATCDGTGAGAAGLPSNDGTTCFYPDGTKTTGQSTGTCWANPSPTKCVFVNIRVTIPIITPIISNIVGGSFTLTARSVAPLQ